MARPTKLNDDMRQKIDEYIERSIANKDVPSVAGLAVELSISKVTLYNWSENDKELLNTLEGMKSLQEAMLLKGGLKNEYNATIVKLMLANHGYREKSEQDITSGGQSINQVLVKFVGEDANEATNN